MGIERSRLAAASKPATMRLMPNPTPVCDYEGSDYRTRFWQNQGRDYEDQVERVALRRLLPPRGRTLLDVGAGFGRLADEYAGYDRVVLFDYSRSLLREGRDHLGDDPRFIFVAGNWYNMPFVDGLFDALVQVRTLHHAADVPALFSELARIAHRDATYVLEFASKHNLKAMLRFWLGRQSWSPFQEQPVEFVELNFDFHPDWTTTASERSRQRPTPSMATPRPTGRPGCAVPVRSWASAAVTMRPTTASSTICSSS